MINQMTGHHGLLEIYAHVYSSMFLFLMSMISIFVLYYYFRSSIFKYQGLLNGIFYTSLIGLGESLEHVFLDKSLFISSVFHYIHLIAAPTALIFYILSIGEIFGGATVAKMDAKKSITIFIAILFVSMMLSGFSKGPWDERVEIPFVLITAIPTLVLVREVFEKSKIVSESTLMLASLRIILFGVSSLTISILAGRYGDITSNAQVYILFHQIQNISHVFTGTALLVLVMTLSQIERVVSSGSEKDARM